MEKRLIDINPIIRDLTAMKSMYDAIALDGMIKALEDAPTLDAVEVVRCKDCKYRNSSEECECRLPDAFCSDGERRPDNV